MKNFWLDRRKERQKKKRNINIMDFNKNLLQKMIQARGKKP